MGSSMLYKLHVQNRINPDVSRISSGRRRHVAVRKDGGLLLHRQIRRASRAWGAEMSAGWRPYIHGPLRDVFECPDVARAGWQLRVVVGRPNPTTVFPTTLRHGPD